ncbi:conserved unknown protein [Ectocarpus siliculosus]|uniref:Polymorphic outer membrane protein n=1 Tax=Ectocarpus siliculosus TaxID=2880 RepID=D7FTU5_ECTSI|nr:conserved unknown protein [Ectocarpus siliculosus]|eukprot:CBJ31472.1 conserved unknown protein [Ectocarpus siliculosus]
MGPAAARLLLLCFLLAGGALSQVDDDGYCDGLSESRTVSTTAEASALGADLARCQGLEFIVAWQGTVSLSEPLQVVNSTTLQITGESKEQSVGVALTGGYGVDGGAVAAVGASSVTLVDCDVYGNRVTSNGGAVFLGGASSFTAGWVNFTGNSADVYGGAIHSQGSSTVTFGDGGAVSISGNTAEFQGGAVNLQHSCTMRTGGTTWFIGNQAGSSGGAVWAFNGSEVVITGATSFIENTSQNYGGAVMVTEGSAVRIRGNTTFTNNYALFDGGAVYADVGVTVALSGTQLYENNSARGNGGAIHLTLAQYALITGQPIFLGNTALEGSGGAIYSSNVPQATFKNANFDGNAAVWGGAVASFSSGGAASSSSSSTPFRTSGSSGGYDPDDLTPSLTTTAGGATTVTSLSVDPDAGGSGGEEGGSFGGGGGTSSTAAPTKFLSCVFEENHASEDGGAIYSVAGFDMVKDSTFFHNMAASSGGALVHAGVMEEISGTTFEGNGAGNEGPAVVSLGLLGYMGRVTFDGNSFYCEEGTFSTEVEIEGEDVCRFGLVCSRCASECASELEDEVTVADPDLLPACEAVPEGAQTTSRGGTLATLEILPGYYRSSATSTDIRECFYEDACEGGKVVGEYCAAGYTGPYCAVCTAGFSPGYFHSCKSCMGDSRRRAFYVVSAVGVLVLLAVVFMAAKLVSVVETTPSSKAPSRWQQKRSVWQARMKKILPLTAIKIVVVVWQIVTQYSDVAGVEYPGAYKDFLSVVDVVNLDLGFILSLACVCDTDFYDRLLLTTICPAVVLGLLGCTYLAMGVVKHRHLSVALFIMFVIYATVSYTIFETFVCDPLDDGNSYLRSDYSLTCDTETHTAYRVYAGLMILVYPVGIPCVFGWWLFKHRHELKQEGRERRAVLKPAADLWEPYKPSTYYYEVVECFRRIALTGFAVFIYPDSSAQVAIVLLLAIVFMVVSEFLSPFARPVEMWLYRTGHYVVFASMYLALLLRVDVSDERNQSQEVFSGVLVIAHAAMLLVVVLQGLLIFAGWGDLVETPGALANLDDTAFVSKRGGSLSDGDVDEARDGGHYRGYLSTFSTGAAAERGKRWEIWERPLPKARSSFFPSPTGTKRKVVPEADAGRSRDDLSVRGVKGRPSPEVSRSNSWTSSTGGDASPSTVVYQAATPNKVAAGEEDRIRSRANPKKWGHAHSLPVQDAQVKQSRPRSVGDNAAAKKAVRHGGGAVQTMGDQRPRTGGSSNEGEGKGPTAADEGLSQAHADAGSVHKPAEASHRDNTKPKTTTTGASRHKRSVSSGHGGSADVSHMLTESSFPSIATVEYNKDTWGATADTPGTGRGPAISPSAVFTPLAARGRSSDSSPAGAATPTGTARPTGARTAASTGYRRSATVGAADDLPAAARLPKAAALRGSRTPRGRDECLPTYTDACLHSKPRSRGGRKPFGKGSWWDEIDTTAASTGRGGAVAVTGGEATARFRPSPVNTTDLSRDDGGSTAPAAAASAAAASAAGEITTRTASGAVTSYPSPWQRRPNAQVILSPLSSTMSGKSSACGSGVNPTKPAAHENESTAAMSKSGAGGSGGGRRETLKPKIKEQFSTEGLFGTPARVSRKPATAGDTPPGGDEGTGRVAEVSPSEPGILDNLDNAPSFTRTFRSLSSGTLEWESGRSFGALGCDAKISFFPEGLSSVRSPAGLVAASTARGGGSGSGSNSLGSGGSDAIGFIGISSEGTLHGGGLNRARGGGAGSEKSEVSRGGLLKRSRKDVIAHYMNGLRRDRVESFEPSAEFFRPFERSDAKPVGSQPPAATRGAGDKTAPAQAKASAAARQSRWARLPTF